MNNIRVFWENSYEKNVIRYDFGPVWSWTEFIAASHVAFQMIESVSHEVNVIFNMAETENLPVDAPRYFREIVDFGPINMGIIVLAEATPFTQHLIRQMIRMYPELKGRFHIEKDLPSALMMLDDYWSMMVG